MHLPKRHEIPTRRRIIWADEEMETWARRVRLRPSTKTKTSKTTIQCDERRTKDNLYRFFGSGPCGNKNYMHFQYTTLVGVNF
jgi:hypothetical protein